MSVNQTKTKKKIKDRAVEIRRDMQHQSLLNWDRGLCTARECIEKIIELEKIIHIDTKLFKSQKPQGY